MVLKTKDNGITWEEFSPDLTRNLDDRQGKGGGPYTNEAVGAENYGTIAYMIESPHEKGVFWTGSDDGLVHITKDDGVTWENVTPKGLQECLVNAIDISPHDPATAYIATTRYKFNDYAPALYKTTNYGKTWTNISSGIPYGAFTRVVREDASRKDLLYAGTETGIYISWNGGLLWEPFQLNLPITPITDLKVHKGDLVVATSGRSFWILDDLAILSQYKRTNESIKIYKPEPALNGFWGSPLSGNSDKFKGSSSFNGINPANGVVLYYELPKLIDSVEVTLEIKSSNNEIINTMSSIKDKSYKKWDGGPPAAAVLSKKEGLNRFVWNMSYPIMPGVPNVYIEANYRGHKAPPGNYSIQLKVGNKVVSTNAIINENPQYKTADGQYKIYDVFMKTMEQSLTEMHQKVNTLYKAQHQIKDIVKSLKKKPDNDDLVKVGKELINQLVKWDEDMIQRLSKAYDDVENYPNKFTAEYMFLINMTESSIQRVNQSSRNRKKELDTQWKVLNNRANVLIDSAIPKYNKQLWDSGLGAIKMD